ncbi:hypothetical protein PHMEG_00016559 [Phytophthora megakarya]|uniref:Uncharacterized protein n=1 Tax=Phytophthora megakarya TaxID=4795 RepID=A0A225VYZ4_9STRA|nr:hypothetical protein PHMEG_00016559 [Phytophthora megakarya]
MNWMTSGRHRALYSQRGRRRQMHFPSQVQHQRVNNARAPPNSQPARARDSAMPWYIVPVGDDDESQGLSVYENIRVLELERKGAMAAVYVVTEEKPASNSGNRGDRLGVSRKRSGEQQDLDGQGERNENRCIFTPNKKARKYDQLPRRTKLVQTERPSSSVGSMLFFK